MDTPAALESATDRPVQPLGLLQRTAAELAAALDVRDAVTAVLRTGRDVLRTNTCGIALLDETGTVLVPQVPHDGDLAGLGVGREVPLDSATPSAEAARTRQPVLLRDRAELVTRFGAPQALNASVLDLGENSWAMYPLVARGRVVGVLRFGFAREGSLDAQEQVFAATLAGQCALAVERARLLEDARRSAHRYRTLAEVGSLDVFTARPGVGITSEMPGWAALTGRESVSGTEWQSDVHPDDLPGVLEDFYASVRDRTPARFRVRVRGTTGWRWIAAVAVPVVADPTDPDSEVVEWVGSLDDVTDRVRARRRTRALNDLTAALAAASTYPQVLDAVLHACHEGVGAVRATLTVDEGPGEVALRVHRMLGDRTRRSEDVPHLRLDDLVEVAGERGVFPVGRAGIEDLPAGVRPFFHAAADGGETSWAVLPLASRTRWLGTLTLGFTDAEALDADDHEFFLAFARQVAGALDRMQLLQQQRATADVLADALRPGPLPHVPWLSTHRVAVTSAGVEVGGDWAEIIPLPGERVAVVLGDVMGRGARAATVMGEVRTQVRTLALVDPHPTAVLRGLDALAAAGGAEDLVTIFYAVLARDGHLLAASAGHLPPLTCSGGPHYLDVPPGVPVGVEGDERTEVLDVRLEAGSALVVFSDGLVETRERSLTQGLAEVLGHFRDTAHGEPDEIVPTLVRRMVGEDPAGTDTTLVDDDVTVLGLRLR
ncbi:SpoIIE family protein phosphatase [Kineococcus rhizosphaerae]|uniref:Serine phosphatase RsbU (Regulator of sigma subunit) n=1 Tax=Kineococcus rhizosphaerae TaxID=559628 RepID=A0A2T0QWU3_9ACTN|nr:SpoIIE family protein phosphatase [Kineococcus rhizosphaerae]PRY10036.1 serine phosphatase RsbU (regulator of sigma subunit) [Kineococcus rhizosphaerae]